MRRCDLIKTIASAAAAWPLVVRAQDLGRNYRLGFLTQVRRNTPGIVAFFEELRANGFVEGQNLSVVPGGFDACRETPHGRH